MALKTKNKKVVTLSLELKTVKLIAQIAKQEKMTKSAVVDKLIQTANN